MPHHDHVDLPDPSSDAAEMRGLVIGFAAILPFWVMVGVLIWRFAGAH